MVGSYLAHCRVSWVLVDRVGGMQTHSDVHWLLTSRRVIELFPGGELALDARHVRSRVPHPPSPQTVMVILLLSSMAAPSSAGRARGGQGWGCADQLVGKRSSEREATEGRCR